MSSVSYFLVKDYESIHGLYLRVRQGDILVITNTHREVSKYFWNYNGVLSYSYGNDDDPVNGFDYCYDTEFYRDVRMALLSDDYEINLLTELDAIPVYLDNFADI